MLVNYRILKFPLSKYSKKNSTKNTLYAKYTKIYIAAFDKCICP